MINKMIETENTGYIAAYNTEKAAYEVSVNSYTSGTGDSKPLFVDIKTNPGKVEEYPGL
jgi:hypothetical protein